MKTALVIVDAQNVFCHPDGNFGGNYSDRSFVTMGKVIERIRGLVWYALRHRMSIIYLCSNKHARFAQNGRWQTEIVTELKPPPHYPLVFWRRGDDRPELLLSLAVLDYFKNNFVSHVVIAGFYGHLCVVRASMEALRAPLFVTVASDCAYPTITPRKQALLKERFLRSKILTEETGYFLQFKTYAEILA